jgi:hypothetical protein
MAWLSTAPTPVTTSIRIYKEIVTLDENTGEDQLPTYRFYKDTVQEYRGMTIDAATALIDNLSDGSVSGSLSAIGGGGYTVTTIETATFKPS